MGSKIDTVREALDFTLAFLHDQYGYNNGSEVDFYGDSLSPGARETRDKIVSALAALSAIDLGANRLEARAEGVRLAAARARKYFDGLPYYEGSYTNGLHAAIDTEAIRLEEHKRCIALVEKNRFAIPVILAQVAYNTAIDDCISILGAEPVQDDGKPKERGAEGLWHTNQPTNDGLYLVEVSAKFSSPSPWYETAFYRKREGWTLPKQSDCEQVLAWMEIPSRADAKRRIEEAGE